MLFKLVLLAANAMHWFNPVVYLMLRQADEDIELLVLRPRRES